MDLQKTLRKNFALNLSTYNKFYLNRAFKGLYSLRCDSSKVVLILNKYLNIYCVIICLRGSFGAQTNLKKFFAQKLSPFNSLCVNRDFKGLFLHRSDSSKVVLIPNEYLNIEYIIISLRNLFGAKYALKIHFELKQSHYD